MGPRQPSVGDVPGRCLGPTRTKAVGAVSNGHDRQRNHLDFMNAEGEIAPQHYAFLVSETEFDEIFGRVRARSLPYWADPARTRPGEINHHDDGRGFYFGDPDGHFLEVITRPYGSGGYNP